MRWSLILTFALFGAAGLAGFATLLFELECDVPLLEDAKCTDGLVARQYYLRDGTQWVSFRLNVTMFYGNDLESLSLRTFNCSVYEESSDPGCGLQRREGLYACCGEREYGDKGEEEIEFYDPGTCPNHYELCPYVLVTAVVAIVLVAFAISFLCYHLVTQMKRNEEQRRARGSSEDDTREDFLENQQT